MLLYNSRLKLFGGKLKSKWTGPFEVIRVTTYGTMELGAKHSSIMFLVNGKQVKHYFGGDIEHEKASITIKSDRGDLCRAAMLNQALIGRQSQIVCIIVPIYNF